MLLRLIATPNVAPKAKNSFSKEDLIKWLQKGYELSPEAAGNLQIQLSKYISGAIYVITGFPEVDKQGRPFPNTVAFYIKKSPGEPGKYSFFCSDPLLLKKWFQQTDTSLKAHVIQGKTFYSVSLLHSSVDAKPESEVIPEESLAAEELLSWEGSLQELFKPGNKDVVLDGRSFKTSSLITDENNTKALLSIFVKILNGNCHWDSIKLRVGGTYLNKDGLLYILSKLQAYVQKHQLPYNADSIWAQLRQDNCPLFLESPQVDPNNFTGWVSVSDLALP